MKKSKEDREKNCTKDHPCNDDNENRKDDGDKKDEDKKDEKRTIRRTNKLLL